MRIIRALPLMVAALAFVACGSSSSKKSPDAHINGTPDAPSSGTPDAPSSGTPDAAMSGVATWNGATCSQSMACLANNSCLLATQGATTGICAPKCGTTTNTTPPGTTANSACKSAYTGTGGTPFCAASIMTGTNAYDWYCVLACGTLNGTNLGTCPTGEKCTLQSGQTYGFCDPM